MTKFNPHDKDTVTFSEALDPAMNITDAEEAKQYFEDYVKYLSKFPNPKHNPEDIARINIGYWAGYYGIVVQERVERLFFATHPIFGPTKC